MQMTTGQYRVQQHSSAPWRRRGCTLAVLGSLAGCGGGDASALIGAAVVTSSTTQAVPPADPAPKVAASDAGPGAHACPAGPSCLAAN